MLDPNWTPEAGYSHADRLLAIIRAQEADDSLEPDSPLSENPPDSDS